MMTTEQRIRYQNIHALEEKRDYLAREQSKLWRELAPKKETGTPKYCLMKAYSKEIFRLNRQILNLIRR